MKTNENRSQKGLSYLRLEFRKPPPAQDAWVEYRTCSLKADKRDRHLEVCDDFANHGHCKNGKLCEKSHDIVRIVEEKMGGSKQMKCTAGDRSGSPDSPSDHSSHKAAGPSAAPSAGSGSGGHRAGFDAFMTGYTFAAYLAHSNTSGTSVESLESAVKNKVYLMSKSFPLSVQKSAFSKVSASHACKAKSMAT